MLSGRETSRRQTPTAAQHRQDGFDDVWLELAGRDDRRSGARSGGMRLAAAVVDVRRPSRRARNEWHQHVPTRAAPDYAGQQRVLLLVAAQLGWCWTACHVAG